MNQYLLLFFEGIATFVSPCLLPMLPIYIIYFTGEQNEKSKDNKKVLINSIGFVIGFTIIFVLLGAFAGFAGRILIKYRTWINIITGSIVIFFGLFHLGIINLNIFKSNNTKEIKITGFFSALLFGIVFSISWTPCIGVFLGSALSIASQKGSTFEGVKMLLFYSIGLGIPFVLSAVLINDLKKIFIFIKKHYKTINFISGILLIIIGLLMFFGKYDLLFN